MNLIFFILFPKIKDNKYVESMPLTKDLLTPIKIHISYIHDIIKIFLITCVNARSYLVTYKNRFVFLRKS